ncbi:MAG: carbohydrate binding domain-containing protein [Clostridia bacterium]|nr:carbohydrate binding domain-containing protein [Clostridia bacterium]
MSKVKKIMLTSLCLALCGTMGGAMAVMASADDATYVAPTDNLVANYGVETDAAGYSGNGATVEVSTDYAYEGNASLKVSGRNSGNWNAFNIDVTGVEFDKWYEYSFYAYTTAEGGSDIAAQLSPWSCNAGGAWLYTYVTGPWAHINANEWVEISMQFQFTVIDGAMYVKFLDGDGNENNALCKADNGDTAFEGNYTYNFVRMTFQASQSVDIYADAITVSPVVEESEDEIVNLIANSGFETDTAGYGGNGAAIEKSTEYAYEGDASLKVSGRNTGTWNAYTIDVAGVEFDKWYEYSFYAYTTAEGGSDIAAQLSPWSCNADGAWLYTYVTGPWGHINANEWVEISMQFQFTVIDGAMYVKFLDAEGNENNALCKADNGDTAFEGNYTYNFVRMTFNATQDVDIYADNVVVALAPENDDTETPEEPAIESPKGHFGGTDASLIPGNWLPNATFDNNLFSTSLNNDGVWYYTSPEKLTQNTEYSQDGTDYGCSAQLSNRQSAWCSAQVRSLNVWVDSVYEFAGYISASQATKAGFGINMWAFNENFTDAQPEQRYPVVRWTGETQEVKPGEWTYFSVLISWKRNAENNTISLLIWERTEDGAEVVAEYETSECTGLSAFEFRFYTDSADENYLSDIFFDNFTLINVHDSIFGAGNEGGDEGEPDDGGVIIPGGDNSSNNDNQSDNNSADSGNVTVPDASNADDNADDIMNKLKGCFSSISSGIAAGATLLAAAFVCGKKRK